MDKKHFIRILIISLCVCMPSHAELIPGKVIGKIMGKSDSSPIEYATVVLCDNLNSRTITGVLTDSTGYFQFTDIKPGMYYIKCKYLGYSDICTATFRIKNSRQTINLGTLFMNDSVKILKNVTVLGRRSTYVQTIDKKIFNVGSDIASNAGSISDLIQNIPSVQADVEGNIFLRGNENVLVLIDGKPSTMMKGSNRGNILQQLPASSIERVEVITNPSAQYKPDGTSGIINLITKKEKKIGVNGSVIANIGNKGRYNAGATLSYATPKWNIAANYGYRHDRRDRYTNNFRTLTDTSTEGSTFISQYTDSKAPSSSHVMGIVIQWKPTSKDQFGWNENFTYMTFPRNERNRLLQRSNNQTEKEFTRYRHDNETQKDGEGTISYVHDFSGDKSLTIDYTHSLSDEVERNLYQNNYTIPLTYETRDSTHIKQKNNENLIRMIYDDKINKNNHLTIGYEAELDKSDMRYLAKDYAGSRWIKNTQKSNDYLFYEQVHSLYATYEHTIVLFKFLAGLRGEQSYIKSNLLTLSQQVKDHYFMFYPTFHISYKPNNRNEFQLNYSLRVNRPEGDDLNPFPEYQDPYNIKAGNPYLKPEKIHSMEFGWQYKYNALTLILTPYYRYTFNKMTDITQNIGSGVMKTTKENMSSSSAAGMEFIINSSVGSWLTYNFNSNLFYNKIDASDLGYTKNKRAIAWYIAWNSNLNITKNFMFQMNTRYNSSSLTPQGNKKATFIMNMGAKYEFPKYNLSVIATVSDLFDTYKNIIEIHTPTISQQIERRRTPRIFYIGLTYRFGSNTKNKKHKNDLQYDENL